MDIAFMALDLYGYVHRGAVVSKISIKSKHRKLTKRMTDKQLNDRKIKIANRKLARKEAE